MVCHGVPPIMAELYLAWWIKCCGAGMYMQMHRLFTYLEILNFFLISTATAQKERFWLHAALHQIF